MKQRTVTLLAGGTFILLIAYIVLPLVFEKWMAPPESEYHAYLASYYPEEQKSGFAPVRLWAEAPPEEKGFWRTDKAARLLLVRGQAFVGDVLLRKENIREYLDAKVDKGEIDCVVVFPTKGSKWGEIFPVIDECRKSRVRVVLLNQYES